MHPSRTAAAALQRLCHGAEHSKAHTATAAIEATHGECDGSGAPSPETGVAQVAVAAMLPARCRSPLLQGYNAGYLTLQSAARCAHENATAHRWLGLRSARLHSQDALRHGKRRGARHTGDRGATLAHPPCAPETCRRIWRLSCPTLSMRTTPSPWSSQPVTCASAAGVAAGAADRRAHACTGICLACA